MNPSTLWLQISAGRGPAECEYVVGQLVPRLSQNLAAQGLSVEEIARTAGEQGGDARSILLRISGSAAAMHIQSWLGTIQWIGTSPYRPHHGRKNWFVSVAAFEEPTADCWKTAEVRVDTLRASGPGGQHVNRTESAVRVTHLPTGLTAMAQEERSQHLNRRLALARLANLFAERAETKTHEEMTSRWRQHTQLIRGNPVRIYRGKDWTLVSGTDAGRH